MPAPDLPIRWDSELREPLFAGTQVSVLSLLDHVVQREASASSLDDSITSFIERFPSVRREQVLDFLTHPRFQEPIASELWKRRLVIPPAWLTVYPAHRSGALDAFGALVDESILRDISREDYCECEEAHYAALTSIWKDGAVVAPLAWEPGEVLNLTGWCTPDAPNSKPWSGRRGHIARGFCCAALLLAETDPVNRGNCHLLGEVDWLINLVDSAFKLGADVLAGAGSFLTWRSANWLKLDEPDGILRRALALIFLISADQSTGWDERTADDTVRWLLNQESTLRASLVQVQPESKPRMVGLASTDLCHAACKEFAIRLLETTSHPGLRSLGERVMDGSLTSS